MRKFNVTGMSCASCTLRVEKAVNALENVNNCSVSLLTNTLTVNGTATDDEIISAVQKAGYNAFAGNGIKNGLNKSATFKKLIVSFMLLLVLMYFSAGQNMLNLPLPAFLNNYTVIGAVQCITAFAVIFVNKKLFVNGIKGVLCLAPNMDTLVSLGSGVAFLYSLYCYVLMVATHNGEILPMLYFESSAMILVLITVGKTLEEIRKGKTVSALNGLIKLKPETAVIISDNSEKTIPISELKVGDIFVLHPGDGVPADGVIIEGSTSVNEAAITGENMPSDKLPGDNVTSGTVNITGYVKCKALKVGEDTLLSGIIQKVTEVTATKAPIARVADTVAAYFVPAVTLIAVLTAAVLLISGKDVSFAIARGISVLVISCPCSLGLATPVAITVGSGVAAKNGILFKNAEALEICGRVNLIAFDKTGTLTEGKPVVTDTVTNTGISEIGLLSLALSLESKSKHPLALSVTEKAKKSNAELFEVTDFENKSGFGVVGKINGEIAFAGNLKLANEYVNISDKFAALYNDMSLCGKTVMFFGTKEKLYGIIAVADKIRDDGIITIKKLKSENTDTVLLTGDNTAAAESVANKLNINKFYASLLPNEKSEKISELKQKYITAMVGDGINDAVALSNADVGIAVANGSDTALNSADVVLLNDSLLNVYKAVKISRKVLKNIKENLFWAFFYNVLAIPVAAGVLIPFGITVNPMIAAGCMGLSSICVVTNALRLNNIKFNGKEKSIMKTLTVEGMMCEHCEARVKKVLEQLPGVIKASADYKTNTVTVQLSDGIDNSVLKSVIENEGYTVTQIK